VSALAATRPLTSEHKKRDRLRGPRGEFGRGGLVRPAFYPWMMRNVGMPKASATNMYSATKATTAM
jgi:hypothetical protein